jgi:SAM-dependent methyltransferase
MQTAEFAKMRALCGTHWWFLGRKHLLRALLGSAVVRDLLILDAGCGTGLAEDVLDPLGTVIGIDVAPEALCDRASTCPERLCLASIDPAPFRSGIFDLVVALDIIEHIEDDAAALREMHRLCRPGGRLLITVPAYDWLRSAHDEALGHYRRYSVRQIADLMRDAGFRPTKVSYSVTAPFPAAVAFRFLRRLLRSSGGSDMFEVPRLINSAMTALMRLEAALIKRVNLPFGLSVVAIGIRDLE